MPAQVVPLGASSVSYALILFFCHFKRRGFIIIIIIIIITAHFTSQKEHLRKSLQFTPHHFTSLHLLTINPHLNSLCLSLLTIFVKVFILQEKDASKYAGNMLQLLVVLFTTELSYSSIFFNVASSFYKIFFVNPRSA